VRLRRASSNPRFRLLSKFEAELGRSEGTDSAIGIVQRSTVQLYTITGGRFDELAAPGAYSEVLNRLE
jgi:hypothetical protein